MGSVPPVAGQYVQGFVGLNTFIYEPVGYDPINQQSVSTPYSFEQETINVLGVNFGVDLEQNSIYQGAGAGLAIRHKNYLFSHELANTASYFSALMLHRNGPYGFPMWKQMRIGQNPLTRKQIKENVFTIVTEPGDEIRRQHKDGVSVLINRYGDIRRFDEVPVTSRFKPFSFVGGMSIIDPKTKNNVLKRFNIRATLANDTCFFNNEELNRIYDSTMCTNPNYDMITEMYLDDGLNNDCSPVDSFELFKYSETVYPPQIYTYKSYTRERTTFHFPWNTDRATRNLEGIDSDDNNVASGLYNHPITASFWPLDVEQNYLTDPLPDRIGCSSAIPLGDAGLLSRGYLQFQGIAEMPLLKGLWSGGINCGNPLPYYSRRHTMQGTASVVSPDGIQIPATGAAYAVFPYDDLYIGSAMWEAGSQAGKYPFQNSYSDFAHQLRLRGQGYSIVPEYRESNLVNKMYVSGALNVTGGLLSVTGGLESHNTDSGENFFTIYTNSDFLKHFDLAKEHHKDFAEPSSVTLKCKAVKKFVPYEGFYPAQRCDQIASQFFQSYKNHLRYGLTNDDGTTAQPTGSYIAEPSNTFAKAAMQNFLTPLFAPGILFNTIKGGVACSWPHVSSSMVLDSDGDASGSGYQILTFGSGSDWSAMAQLAREAFNNRIPFESLIEPDKYLSGKPFFPLEPGFFSSSYAMWGGQGDPFYTYMMDNFLAEVPEFFLENKNFTFLYSKKQDDPSFGVAEANKPYSMRVKMYKSLTKAKTKVTGSGNFSDQHFDVPQTIPEAGVEESITMYSRPSAFGPPSCGTQSPHLASYTEMDTAFYNEIEHGSEYGYNYPFTPPYYHGEGWADILFLPTESRKYSLSEIIGSSSMQQYRYFDPSVHYSVVNVDATVYGNSDIAVLHSPFGGPQMPHAINANALQLDSSVNLFSQGIVQVSDKLKLSSTEDPDARWIIQSKFETPILNFRNVSVTNPTFGSGSVPRGMWHQYGVLPSEQEGVYLQVVDIPKSFLVSNGFTQTQAEKTGSLADLVGFTNEPARMGEVANTKKAKEAVVAVPFVERDGHRQYFKMPRADLEYALDALTDPLSTTKRGKLGESVFQMVMKMKQYNFPPVMNFIDFEEVDPFYMYIFEFSHQFSKSDLADMWQNLPPTLNDVMETAEATISHPILAKEILGGGVVERQNPSGAGMITLPSANGNEIPSDIKWMVFKVKQKAKKRYFKKIAEKRQSFDVSERRGMEGAGYGPTGKDIKFGYNWPYDFFSMVELVKIDAEVTLSDIDIETETIKPKVGKSVPPKVTEKFNELNEYVKKGRRK
jgi:hypothetical protein